MGRKKSALGNCEESENIRNINETKKETKQQMENEKAKLTYNLFENFRFDVAADRLYHVFWHEYADWYIELVKSDLQSDGPGPYFTGSNPHDNSGSCGIHKPLLHQSQER